MQEIERANTTDPNMFWNFIKKLNPRKSKQIPMEVMIDGNIYTDEKTVISHWASEFKGLLTPPDMNEMTQQRLQYITESNRRREISDQEMNIEINVEFNEQEVRKLVMKSKNGKAPGLDSIIYETLKNNVAIQVLTNLFNICLSTGMVPTIWSKAIISPIPKSSTADPRVPLNYRGISLLPVISKLYTAGLSNRISNYFEKEHTFSNEQNGFRPNRSCLDHIYTLHNAARIRQNQKKDTFLTFIDFSKAFDYVQKEYLLHKLLNYNINGNVYNSIKAIYNNPVSCVRLGGTLSDWFPISSGVRQGDSLSPVLFATFINDLSSEINALDAGIDVNGDKLSLLMYADDIVLISSNPEQAQDQLDVMTRWCSQWGMSINSKKSQILHVRNHQKPLSTKRLYCCGQALEYVETYKYLGYYMHEHLSHHKTVEILANSAKRAFGRVVNVFKKLGNMGYKTYETLVFSNVFSILNYGAGVWGFKEYHNSRTFQNKIIRYYLGTHRFTPLAATHIEMDWSDNRHIHWLEMIRLKNRINEMPTNRWPKKIWQWDRVSKTDAWFKEIKHILRSVNMANETDLSNSIDVKEVGHRLLQQARSSWETEAENKPKLRTFLKIHDFNTRQNVIKSNLSRAQRSLVVKLKAGVLPIRLETGRYKGLPEALRICEICHSGEVESEMHHLHECVRLQYVRNRHPIARETRNMIDNGMSKTDVTKFILRDRLKEAGVWIADMWKERRRLLYN